MNTVLKAILTSAALAVSLVSCGSNPLSSNDLQQTSEVTQQSNDVAVKVTEVYYNDCFITDDNSIIIKLDSNCTYAQMQLRNHPCMPYFCDWELDVGTVAWYDYRLHQLHIDDPRHYFDASYQFKVIQFLK
jgi:hypothetical protein